jgi:hypothetical protein
MGMNSQKGKWLLDEKSSSLFLLSSIIILITGILLVVLGKLSRPSITRELSANPEFYWPLVVILALNALSAGFLVVGMLWYWRRFDDSRRFVKLLWLGSFVALGWYSMSIYYLFVYRRQRAFVAGAHQ